MKEIKLTQGKVAMIDDDDFEEVSKYSWFAQKGKNTFYAYTWIGDWKERKMLSMHHLINGKPPKGIFTDHIDRNGLNNRRNNLRESTVQQNSANRTPYGTSRYLGVRSMKRKSGIFWRAFIGKKYLGYFKTEEEAALKYNEAAIEIHGEFANLNIIEEAIGASVVVAEYDTVGAIIIQ